MYIRRKVFSLMEDVNGDLRYFSTTDYDYDDLLMERLYADLEDEDSGIGRRAAIIGGAGALGAAGATGIGAYLNRKAAYDAALAGKKKSTEYQLAERDLKAAVKKYKDDVSGLKKISRASKFKDLNNLKKMQAAYDSLALGESKALSGLNLTGEELKKLKEGSFNDFATAIDKRLRSATLMDQYERELKETGRSNKKLAAEIKKLGHDSVDKLSADAFKGKESAEKALNKLTKKYETEAAKAGKGGMWKFGKKGAAGIALGGLGLAGAAALATRRRDE